MQKQPENRPNIPLKNSIIEMAMKSWGNIVVSTIICVIVCIALSFLMVKAVWGQLIVQLCCLLVSGMMIYGYMWGQGDRDANFIQFGRMQPEKWKGLKVGLLAIVPNLLLNIPLALSMLKVLPFDFLPVYRIMNAPVWPLINMIHPYGALDTPAYPATETMEAIAATSGLSWGGFALMVILPLMFVVLSTIGYELGVRRISIGFKIMYDEKKGAKKK